MKRPEAPITTAQERCRQILKADSWPSRFCSQAISNASSAAMFQAMSDVVWSFQKSILVSHLATSRNAKTTDH
jgi:hypothetical protein